MTDLVLAGLRKTYAGTTALDDVSLTVPGGGFTCLLGPSGCGKTTLLRLVAGLERPDRGTIRLGDEDLTALPAHRRGLGMVFQSLALFPHMSVLDNVAYGLKVQGIAAEERRARGHELLDLVQLPGVADRQVSQLSGGQRQRVAIARALALEPRLFLLDEPLSALDAKLREEMQVELRQLQRRLGVTTILVTHDQREAMTMADTIVVMEEGRVRQAGPPLEVYRRPASRFVADFLGGANLIEARLTGPRTVALDGTTVALAEPADIELGPAVLSIRPEAIDVETDAEVGDNRLPARVAFVRDLGHQVEVMLDTASGRITALLPAERRGTLSEGAAVTVRLPPDACLALAR
ncbi:MAG TPA: ABC transporter ATP-binding protein [Thermohalobaculum sp.]|nr:ABC transporter ATP-binding protein [Thermohalobaculum sp.]